MVLWLYKMESRAEGVLLKIVGGTEVLGASYTQD
jgi:hypothetical protein